jgi:hypothetical protein
MQSTLARAGRLKSKQASWKAAFFENVHVMAGD